MIGVGGGAQIDLNLSCSWGNGRASGARCCGHVARATKASVALGIGVARHVLPLLALRRISVPVCDTFPLSEAETAYGHFVEGCKVRQGGPRRFMIDAVLFDGDQTLWDFERVMRQALIAVADGVEVAHPGAFTAALRWEDLQVDRTARVEERKDVWSLASVRVLGFTRTLQRRRDAGGGQRGGGRRAGPGPGRLVLRAP